MRGSLILLVFAVPLAISPFSTNIYNVPKSFISSLLILFIFALWLSRWDEKGSISLPTSYLSLPILAFFLASLLSMAKALDFYQALTASYRLLTYLLLYHLVLYVIQEHRQVETLFRVMGLTGAAVAVYGLFQYWGWDFMLLSERFRPVSFLGNTGYAAEYLILVIPLSLVLFLRAPSFLEKVLWASIGGLLLAHLLFTQARGPWLGLFISITWMGWVLYRRYWKGKASIPLGRKEKVGVFLGLTLFLLFFALYPGLLSRIWSIFDPTYPSNRFRLLVWSSTLKIIAENPFFGVGFGNYELHYPPFRTVEEWRLSEKLVVANAHNDYLQIAAETGLIGLGLFLWLLLRVSISLHKNLRYERDSQIFLLSLGLGGSLTALLVSAFFAFPFQNPTPSLYFWLFLGLISSLERIGGQAPKKAIALPRVLAWGAAIPLLALSYLLVIGQFLADLHLEKARQSFLRGRETEAFTEYQKAIFFYFPNLYTHELQRKAFSDKRIYERAVQAYQEALTKNPNSAELHADLGATLGEMGLYREAIEELRKALELNPELSAARENLGHAYLLQGQWEEAIREYQKTIELDPKSARARLYLGIALYGKGEKKEAQKEWDKALALEPGLKGKRLIIKSLINFRH